MPARPKVGGDTVQLLIVYTNFDLFSLPNLNIRSGQKLAAQHQKSKYARLEWFSFTSKLETLISFLSVDTAPKGNKDYPTPASWKKRIFFMAERRTTKPNLCISKYVS